MGLVVGFGYFLIALGPALTIFTSAIAPKPFLILAVLARLVGSASFLSWVSASMPILVCQVRGFKDFLVGGNLLGRDSGRNVRFISVSEVEKIARSGVCWSGSGEAHFSLCVWSVGFSFLGWIPSKVCLNGLRSLIRIL